MHHIATPIPRDTKGVTRDMDVLVTICYVSGVA